MDSGNDAKKSKLDFDLELKTVEMHSGGEPLRIVTCGYPRVEGATVLEKRRYCREKLDHLRKMLMFEPRGHHDMYGAVLVEPDMKEAHIGVIFMHNEGYSTMCGHAVIALGRYAVDHGMVKGVSPETQVNIQCPCGLVRVFVQYDDKTKKSGRVRFESVPAFAFATQLDIQTEKYGSVTVDIGYGGAFYALADAGRFGLNVRKSRTRDLVEAASHVTECVKHHVELHHPDDKDLAFLYGTILTDGKDGFDAKEATANICVFADAEVDRCPTGSGVTARIAVQYHRGLIKLNQLRVFQSIVGSEFTGKAIKTAQCGEFPAVVVEVSGHGYYTGTATFTAEEGDELAGGFLLH